jgi:SM-20-related protein
MSESAQETGGAADSVPDARWIRVQIQLAGGHSREVTLSEDSSELRELFAALASPETSPPLIQLPMKGGHAAFSFRPAQLLSIDTEPPVVIDLGAAAVAAADIGAAQVQPARYAVVDDFLSPDEHRDMLAFALECQDSFEAGTVASSDPMYRQNLVIMGFGSSPHSTLLQNRLLVWLPFLLKKLRMPVFPLHEVESQLTAGNDGHFYKTHEDSGEEENPRTLSCVYYFHREPKGFAGGEFRLYDSIHTSQGRRAADTFRVIEPRSNRLVVFPSEESHELCPIRCPSGEFADSRFAATNWVHRATTSDPERVFGWGHFRGAVPPSAERGA